MTVLALDVGERRIGIAVSDPTGTFAFPVDALERTAVRDDLRAIVALARERGVETIVVGDPIRLDGERGPAAHNIDRFVEQLARLWTGRIERVDERLTTAQAQRSLIGADVSRRKRKQVVDKLAAALILETYLARRKAGPD
ncbi:MAG: Holliday junction resolvase RuvX [Candidatus Eremiobacteraeota bacterium]|nr:Holliday junction resolvase RuvX [Candidatus Eremiobacteraeota bacterium]